MKTAARVLAGAGWALLVTGYVWYRRTKSPWPGI